MKSQVDKSAGRKVEAAAAASPRTEAVLRRGQHAHPAGDLGPLGNMIGYALRRAQLAVFDDAIRGCFAELHLRPAQFSVLALLGHRPGLTQSEVAEALSIQRANLVALVDGLERRGLAQRSPVAGDRRCYALHLTDAGGHVLAHALTLVTAIESGLEARLGPGGRAQLLDLLWRLTARH